ncbi:MAG: DUF935 family protein [Rikenellaceae bacterium]
MSKRRKYNNRSRGVSSQPQPQMFGNFNLAKPSDRARLKSTLIEIKTQTEALTQKDIRSWRNAWQVALNIDNPNRCRLYDIYRDVAVDLHASGCCDQRNGFSLCKKFKLVDSKGKEDKRATALLEKEWFSELCNYILESRYWGHSLVQLGDVIVTEDGEMAYKDVQLVPRKHVIPEYGVIVREQGDEPSLGYDYRNTPLTDWLIEAGKPTDLGLYLKVALQTIPKKNMFSYWDQFGEIFGMPIRVAKTTSRDPKDRMAIEDMLSGMGAASWALFPEGTEVDIKETTRGDAFEVYDKRIDRANSEISKGILNQTMTIDSGSSLSQSEVHLEVFENVIESDGVLIQRIVNSKLLPRMVKHGFAVKGLHLEWDKVITYTPEQENATERLLLEHYDVDPAYFTEKYGIKIIGKKESNTQQQQLSLPFFD